MNDNNIKKDIGYILGILKGIEKKLDNVCESVKANSEKINKHENFIGKAGVYIAGFTFFFGLIINFVLNWFREKF